MEVYYLGRFLFSLYQFSKNKENELVKYTKLCGPLAIKLVQFLLMRELIKDKQLEFAFENCDIHDFKETQKMYLQNFDRCIENDYKIKSVIASGSIGQVYLAYSYKQKRKVALKVKHPKIEKSIKTFSRIIKIFLMFFKMRYKKLIIEYIENTTIQLNYIHEAENTIRLKETWKHEPVIIVPEVYTYSNDFICMSYHEGKNYNDLTESQQNKASLYMNFILLESLLVHDFLHADLHTGNWKVVIKNTTMKILIYDCGIMCRTGNIAFNKEIISHILGGTFSELVKVINQENKNTLKVNACSEYLKNNLPTQSIERVRFFINTLLDWNLCTNKHCTCILSAFAIIGEISGSNSKYYTKYIGLNNPMYECLVYIYIGILKNMGLFSTLKQFFENWMDSDPVHKQLYEAWLFERFGHKKGYILSDLIYKKLNV